MEGCLYAAGIYLYRQGVRLAGFKNRKASLLDQGLKNTWEKLEGIDPADRYIWVHAASLGEFEQGRPVIEKIKSLYPEYKILLTFFSPSGYEVRKNYAGADIICYLPFDTPGNVKKFFRKIKPEMAVFVKYEIWRNYLRQLKKERIPAFLISAVFSPEQFFFKPLGKPYRNWLKNFKHIFVQDAESKSLLDKYGFKNVDIAGDTRFDRVIEIKEAGKKVPEIDSLLKDSQFTFVVGSSWDKDEDVYSDWVNSHREVKCIIAPHEFDSERLEKLRSRFTNGAVLLSELKDPGKASTKSADSPDTDTSRNDAQVLIIDCFGLLSSIYGYGDLAYVGGGFGAGIHNLNEAAVYGIPVMFGPNHEKFLEAIDLKTLGGGIAVDSKEGFERNADRMLYDPSERKTKGRFAAEYIQEKAGATGKIMEFIMKDSSH